MLSLQRTQRPEQEAEVISASTTRLVLHVDLQLTSMNTDYKNMQIAQFWDQFVALHECYLPLEIMLVATR